jgi:hypothetical protein
LDDNTDDNMGLCDNTQGMISWDNDDSQLIAKNNKNNAEISNHRFLMADRTKLFADLCRALITLAIPNFSYPDLSSIQKRHYSMDSSFKTANFESSRGPISTTIW